MSYEQHVRHWRNHRKDRFLQQCSGYCGDGKPAADIEPVVQVEIRSFERLIEKAKKEGFPIWIRQYGLYWDVSSPNDCFGTEIGSLAELERFFDDCVK